MEKICQLLQKRTLTRIVLTNAQLGADHFAVALYTSNRSQTDVNYPHSKYELNFHVNNDDSVVKQVERDRYYLSLTLLL